MIEPLTEQELAGLRTIGKGSRIQGVRRLLEMNRSLGNQDELLQQPAQVFIKEYLEHTKDRGDRITVKDLYNQYIELTKPTSFSMSKQKFNKLLTSNGFMVGRSGGNIRTVFNIKSHWI